MGKALILQGADFSQSNLGKVVLTNPKPTTAIQIVGFEYVFVSKKYTVSFTPIDASERIVRWSIVDGDEYATIDGSTGIVTALSGSELSEVTIRAELANNPTIYDEKVILVSEKEKVEYVGVKPTLGTPLYIHSNIAPSADKSYEIIFAFAELGQHNIEVMGSVNTLGSDFFTSSTQCVGVGYDATSGTIKVSNTTRNRNAPENTGIIPTIGKKYKIIISPSDFTIYEDGILVKTMTKASTPAASAYVIALAALNAYNTRRSSYDSKLLIYGFRAYNNDGDIINLQPSLDENGLPCMKDSISGEIRPFVGSVGTLYYRMLGQAEVSIEL